MKIEGRKTHERGSWDTAGEEEVEQKEEEDAEEDG